MKVQMLLILMLATAVVKCTQQPFKFQDYESSLNATLNNLENGSKILRSLAVDALSKSRVFKSQPSLSIYLLQKISINQSQIIGAYYANSTIQNRPWECVAINASEMVLLKSFEEDIHSIKTFKKSNQCNRDAQIKTTTSIIVAVIQNLQKQLIVCPAQNRTVTQITNGTISINQTDQSKITIFSNGTKLIQFLNGTNVTTSNDGTKKEKDMNGTQTITYTNGTTVIISKDGTKLIKSVDGTETIIYINGTTQMIENDNPKTIKDINGTQTITYSNGTVAVVLNDGTKSVKGIDGTEVITYSNGTTQINSNDGLKTTKDINGTQTIIYLNGLVVISSADGTKVTKDVNGTQTMNYLNGTQVINFLNGTTIKTSSDGTIKIKNNDGTQTLKYPNGTIIKTQIDGTKKLSSKNGIKTINYANGTTVTVSTDGIQTTKDINGVQTIDYNNGTKQVTNVDGIKTIIYNNGTQITTFINGTQRTTDLNGTIFVTLIDGSQIITFLNGTKTTKLSNGNTITDYGNGTKIQLASNGTIISNVTSTTNVSNPTINLPQTNVSINNSILPQTNVSNDSNFINQTSFGANKNPTTVNKTNKTNNSSNPIFAQIPNITRPELRPNPLKVSALRPDNPNWIYGESTALEYQLQIQESQRNNVSGCPLDKPFADGLNKCTTCPDIYDYSKKACFACPQNTAINVTLRQCSYPDGTTYLKNDYPSSSVPYKGALPQPNPSLSTCGKFDPYFDGSSCVTCNSQSLFDSASRKCVLSPCLGNSTFDSTLQQCVLKVRYKANPKAQNYLGTPPAASLSQVECPLESPYTSGDSCISCNLPLYFNFSAMSCMSCQRNGSIFSLHYRACIRDSSDIALYSNPGATNYVGSPPSIPVPGKIMEACPLPTPFYNAHYCIHCPELFDYATMSCQQCPHGKVLTNNLCLDLVVKGDVKNSYTINVTNFIGQVPQVKETQSTCPPSAPFFNGTQCLPCQMPSYFDFRLRSCKQCGVNTAFDDGSRKCLFLAPSKVTNPASQNIFYNGDFKDVTYKINGEMAKNATVCPSERPFYDGTTNECISCSFNAPYFNFRYHECMKCNDGTFFDAEEHVCLASTPLDPTVERMLMNVFNFDFFA